MVSSSMAATVKSPNHVRSTSLPSRSHSLAQRVEEQLGKLRTWNTLSSSSSSSSSSSLSSLSSVHPMSEMLCEGLNGLVDLYDCVGDLLELPLTQQALVHHRHEKWGEEALDGCLRMLDVCGSAGDVFMKMKEHVQDLQSALRRREPGVRSKVVTFLSSKRKMKKDIKKCLKASKRTENQSTLFPLLGDNQHLGVVIHVLREVRSITISVFGTISSFMLVSRPKTTLVGRSMVSKWMGMQRVACEGEAKKMSEMERVDATLYSLHSSNVCKDIDAESMQIAQKQLEGLELSIQSLQDGLDCLFRHLIKTRVSLLNIFNH